MLVMDTNNMELSGLVKWYCSRFVFWWYHTLLMAILTNAVCGFSDSEGKYDNNTYTFRQALIVTTQFS
jgi:hypothetical protein